VHEIMNGALAEVLSALGYQTPPFRQGGAWVVTDHTGSYGHVADPDRAGEDVPPHVHSTRAQSLTQPGTVRSTRPWWIAA
jgi:hypothetical protein